MATSEYTLLLHRVGRWQPWFMSHVACVCCACACGPHHHSSSRHFAPLPAIFFPPFESRLPNVRKHVTVEDWCRKFLHVEATLSTIPRETDRSR